MSGGLSCGEIARTADAVMKDYAIAARLGIEFRQGYFNGVVRCAEGSKQAAFKFLKSGWVAPGTATRLYGPVCMGLVTLLGKVHESASDAVFNQQTRDSRFCHAANYSRIRELVSAVVETTGQSRLVHPDSGFSLGGTIRQMTVEPPRIIEDFAPVLPVARNLKPVLSIRR